VKLPNQKNASVSLSKISDYLISETHPVGKWKAKIFQSHGYTQKNIDSLRDGLLSIANEEEVNDIIICHRQKKDRSRPFCPNRPRSWVKTPSGKELNVKTIWIIDTGQEIPRFVTAYPT